MKRVKTATQMKNALIYGAKKADKDFGAIMRESVLKSRSELAILTPKDSGWASRHWSLGLNRTTEDVTVIVDAIFSMGPGDKASIFNNVPYIKRLDEGWSMQRPTGFTHIALSMAMVHIAKLALDLSVEVYKDV